jgi:hypothetical protein
MLVKLAGAEPAPERLALSIATGGTEGSVGQEAQVVLEVLGVRWSQAKGMAENQIKEHRIPVMMAAEAIRRLIEVGLSASRRPASSRTRAQAAAEATRTILSPIAANLVRRSNRRARSD